MEDSIDDLQLLHKDPEVVSEMIVYSKICMRRYLIVSQPDEST